MGKTTLCKRLQEAHIGQNLITCTTRPARSGEIDGQHYYFLSNEKFKQDLADNKFIETAEVHGYFYGIRRQYVEQELANNKTLILNIDVQGAATLRPLFPNNHIDFFIDTASIETLHERLKNRSEDSPDVIKLRLAEAESERIRKDEFQHVLINDDLDTCYKELENYITAYRKEQHV